MSIIAEIKLARREFLVANGYAPERIFVPEYRAAELVDELSVFPMFPDKAASGPMRICDMQLELSGDRIEARAPALSNFVYPWSRYSC